MCSDDAFRIRFQPFLAKIEHVAVGKYLFNVASKTFYFEGISSCKLATVIGRVRAGVNGVQCKLGCTSEGTVALSNSVLLVEEEAFGLGGCNMHSRGGDTDELVSGPNKQVDASLLGYRVCWRGRTSAERGMGIDTGDQDFLTEEYAGNQVLIMKGREIAKRVAHLSRRCKSPCAASIMRSTPVTSDGETS